MKRKNQQYNSPLAVDYLDLHHLDVQHRSNTQDSVFDCIDTFITATKSKHAQTIIKQGSVRIGIICGKGLNSRHFIDGKNPLRYYTEQYLSLTGYQWRNGGMFEGEQGLILVSVE